jgi:hypothetical protein
MRGSSRVGPRSMVRLAEAHAEVGPMGSALGVKCLMERDLTPDSSIGMSSALLLRSENSLTSQGRAG